MFHSIFNRVLGWVLDGFSRVFLGFWMGFGEFSSVLFSSFLGGEAFWVISDTFDR